jgi:hypothetical protein
MLVSQQQLGSADPQVKGRCLHMYVPKIPQICASQ